MKNLSFILVACLVIPFALLAQQSSISGIITIHNSKYETGQTKYVSFAQVEEDFGRSQATISDVNGEFTLHLVGIDEKEQFNFSVIKEGLEVVNLDKLRAVAGQLNPVKVSMASPNQVADFRKKIYKVGRTNAERSLTKRIKQIEIELSLERPKQIRNQKRIVQLEQAYNGLVQSYKEVDDKARALAEKYSRINLDEVSPVFQSAFSSFQEGELELALEILREANLFQQGQKLLKERELIKTIQEEINLRDSIQERRTEEVIQALLLKVDLHKTQYEFDSIEVVFGLILQLDSTNIENQFSYANFLRQQKSYRRALEENLKSWDLINNSSPSEVSSKVFFGTIFNLGDIYGALGSYAEADNKYKLAYNILQKSKGYQPEVVANYTGMVLHNWGTLSLKRKDYGSAEELLVKALRVKKRQSSKDSVAHAMDLVKTLNNLHLAYMGKRNFLYAEAVLNEAIRLASVLDQDNSRDTDELRATIYNTLGGVLNSRNSKTAARDVFATALSIFETLAKKNPVIYEPDVAMVMTNIANLSEGSQADAFFHGSLQIYGKLAARAPEIYLPFVAKVYRGWASSLLNDNDYRSAEIRYQKAVDIFTNLAAWNFKAYGLELVTSLQNLGILYLEDKKLQKSEQVFRRALKITKDMASNEPNIIELRSGELMVLLGLSCHRQESPEKKDSAKLLWQSALAIADKYPEESLSQQISNDVIKVIGVDLADPIFAEKSRQVTALIQNRDKQSTLVEKIKPQERIVDFWKNAHSQIPSNPRIKNKLSQSCASLARLRLYNKDYKGAQESATHSLGYGREGTGSYDLQAYLIFAYANLFQGDYENASKILLGLKKGFGDNAGKLRDLVLKDLGNLEQAGITHPDTEKIVKLLKE